MIEYEELRSDLDCYLTERLSIANACQPSDRQRYHHPKKQSSRFVLTYQKN